MPVHTKPEDSVKELDELYDVFQDVKTKWKTDVNHYAQLQYLYDNHPLVETGFINLNNEDEYILCEHGIMRYHALLRL